MTPASDDASPDVMPFVQLFPLSSSAVAVAVSVSLPSVLCANILLSFRRTLPKDVRAFIARLSCRVAVMVAVYTCGFILD